jgi:MoxR-like ATPase
VAQFPPPSVAALTEELRGVGYLADRGLATAAYLALTLGRPLLLEGEVGVGKTELAKTLAGLYGRQLIRLQCYEGIDAGQALYEWDYARQMLKVRAMHESRASADDAVDHLYSDEFLVERPLLQAIRAGAACVLLVDEVDRADDEFEAFLLEILSDFQVTIPERGTVTAASKPLVILTSNRTRELHDALKRRCLYHWIGFPAADREIDIVTTRIPAVREAMAARVVAAVNRLRDMDLAKPPGVAETLDWVSALDAIGADSLDEQSAADTLGAVVKDRDDLELVAGSLGRVVGDA